MALQDVVRILSTLPTLGGLEADALRLIAFSGEMRILRAGDILFSTGDLSDGGYVLLGGVVALEIPGQTPNLARAPVLIGDTALIAETRRPCTARAKETSSALRISRNLFHRVLLEYPESAQRLLATLQERIATLGEDLQRLGRFLD